MEENKYKRLSNPEIEEFYSRAMVQLEPALAQMLTRMIMEVLDKRQEESGFDFDPRVYIPDEEDQTETYRRARQKDFFDTLGYIPKDCVVCVTEEEI